MAKKGKLLFKLILILVIAGAFIAVHEEVHVLLFSMWHVDSQVEWLSLPPRTVPDQTQLAQLSQGQLDSLNLAQSVLEVVTYPLMLALGLFVLLKK
jgi:hypothetical protein